jgi:hypothetical protein
METVEGYFVQAPRMNNGPLHIAEGALGRGYFGFISVRAN